MRILMMSAVALAAFGATPSLAQTQNQDWSGPYVGIFGGHVQANDDEDERLGFDRNLDGRYGDTVSTAAGADAFSPGFCGGAAKGTTQAMGCDKDADGAEAGVRMGYDWQFGNVVAGVVGEYSVMDVEDSVTGFSTTPANYVFTRNLEQVAAARLRMGYAMGPALVYGTGGYAYGKFDNRFASSNMANSFSMDAGSEDGDGWQAGAGVEYALAGGLTLTTEYLYTSLEADSPVVRVGQGTSPSSNPFVLAPNTVGTDMVRSNGRFGAHHVRIGMNYRF